MKTKDKHEIYDDVMLIWNDKKNRPISQKEMEQIANFFYEKGENFVRSKVIDYLEDFSGMSYIEIEAIKHYLHDIL
jgi:hypothetical protein